MVLQHNNPDFIPSQMVTNTETAMYQNTLVISSANPDGVYTCSVSNRRGYSTSSTGIGSEFTNAQSLPQRSQFLPQTGNVS